VIVIAHRLSTVRHADMIVVCGQQGQIVSNLLGILVILSYVMSLYWYNVSTLLVYVTCVIYVIYVYCVLYVYCVILYQ